MILYRYKVFPLFTGLSDRIRSGGFADVVAESLNSVSGIFLNKEVVLLTTTRRRQRWNRFTLWRKPGSERPSAVSSPDRGGGGRWR